MLCNTKRPGHSSGHFGAVWVNMSMNREFFVFGKKECIWCARPKPQRLVVQARTRNSVTVGRRLGSGLRLRPLRPGPLIFDPWSESAELGPAAVVLAGQRGSWAYYNVGNDITASVMQGE